MGSDSDGLDYWQRDAVGRGLFTVSCWVDHGTVESNVEGLDWKEGPNVY
ncbi:hypothetical protein [Nocardia arizonensis]|nr:hypothetical protein [Nocardia arizonensis]